MKRDLLLGGLITGLLSSTSGALAQGTPAAAPPPMAETQPATSPPPAMEQAPAPVPPPDPGQAITCTPACRAGYLCHQGTCISACNPPCPAGSQCQSDGSCLQIGAAAAPAPAPAPAAPMPPPGAAPAAGAPPPAPQPAYPEPPPPSLSEGPQTIDQRTGFFLQFGLGAGGVNVEDKYTGEFTGTETISGSGVSGSFRIGGGVGGGVVLGLGITTLSGTFDYEDDYGTGVTNDEVDASASVYTFFVQKYLGSFFLRGGLGYFVAGSDDDDDPDSGFVYGIGLGADFPVSTSWSLGFGANLHLSSGDYYEEDYEGEYSARMWSLHFTATYF